MDALQSLQIYNSDSDSDNDNDIECDDHKLKYDDNASNPHSPSIKPSHGANVSFIHPNKNTRSETSIIDSDASIRKRKTNMLQNTPNKRQKTSHREPPTFARTDNSNIASNALSFFVPNTNININMNTTTPHPAATVTELDSNDTLLRINNNGFSCKCDEFICKCNGFHGYGFNHHELNYNGFNKKYTTNNNSKTSQYMTPTNSINENTTTSCPQIQQQQPQPIDFASTLKALGKPKHARYRQQQQQKQQQNKINSNCNNVKLNENENKNKKKKRKKRRKYKHEDKLVINSIGTINGAIGNKNTINNYIHPDVKALKPPKKVPVKKRLFDYVKEYCDENEKQFVMYLLILFIAFHKVKVPFSFSKTPNRMDEMISKVVNTHRLEPSDVRFITNYIIYIMENSEDSWNVCQQYVKEYGNGESFDDITDLTLPPSEHDSLSLIALAIACGSSEKSVNIVQTISNCAAHKFEREFAVEMGNELTYKPMEEYPLIEQERVTMLIAGLSRYYGNGTRMEEFQAL